MERRVPQDEEAMSLDQEGRQPLSFANLLHGGRRRWPLVVARCCLSTRAAQVQRFDPLYWCRFPLVRAKYLGNSTTMRSSRLFKFISVGTEDFVLLAAKRKGISMY